MQKAAQSGSVVGKQAAALKLAVIYKDAGIGPLTALASPFTYLQRPSRSIAPLHPVHGPATRRSHGFHPHWH